MCVTRPARILLVPLLLALLAPAGLATWSIVLVDTETREVAIGSATCLEDWDLRAGAGVVRVGWGAGQVQGLAESNAILRNRIYRKLARNWTAPQILDNLIQIDGNLSFRQYGLASVNGSAATYSGNGNSPWFGGVTGQVGTIHYSIQGNIVSEATVLDAEAAVLASTGDLGQTLMEAMQASKRTGGDTRCVRKSAHAAYMVVARVGDRDGGCSTWVGCARGDYYLSFNILGNRFTPEPVNVLQVLYDQWRAGWSGHADHYLTRCAFDQDAIEASGKGRATLKIRAVDLDGVAVGHGGAQVEVTRTRRSDKVTEVGAVVDHGDGTYSVPVFGSTLAGTDEYEVVIQDGKGPVTLFPFPRLTVEAASLMAGSPTVSAASGGLLPLTLKEAGQAARPYVLLASAGPEGREVVVAAGVLDGQGRAVVELPLPAGVLRSLVGEELTFSWRTSAHASNPVWVSVAE